MAELADAADSKSADLRVLGVRLPLPAPIVKTFPSMLSLTLRTKTLRTRNLNLNSIQASDGRERPGREEKTAPHYFNHAVRGRSQSKD